MYIEWSHFNKHLFHFRFDLCPWMKCVWLNNAIVCNEMYTILCFEFIPGQQLIDRMLGLFQSKMNWGLSKFVHFCVPLVYKKILQPVLLLNVFSNSLSVVDFTVVAMSRPVAEKNSLNELSTHYACLWTSE